jgi:glucosamine-6-phosphate deaminase
MDDYAARGADGSFANVPDDVHYSCRRFGREEILGALNANATDSRIPLENLWVPDAADPDAYDERIRRAGGIDLFLLASGASDGHVAFNPPGSPEDSTTRIVTLADTTRVDNLGTFPDFSSLDEVPEFGITVGIRTIAEFSNRMVMMIAGEHKREAFDTISTASAYSPAWPATVVAIGRDARILADRAAAPSARSTKDERV